MAVCLSVGPGQVGSWIKAFQQIVSIISLLLLPLPTFFTIPAPARFLLRVSLHLVAAPTVALFHQSGRSHPLAVEFEMGCLCAYVARDIWNVRDKQGVLRSPRTGGEKRWCQKMMGKIWKWCLSSTLHHSFLLKSELDLIMMMQMMMTMVASYKSLSPLPSLSERTGLIIPVGHFHLPSLPLCFA